MTRLESGPNVTAEGLASASELLDQLRIIFIANIADRSRLRYDFTHHSITTDFFTEVEYTEILNAFQDFGFYVSDYIEEEQFLHDVINNRLGEPRPSDIVYSTAQRPFGAGRTALIPALCRLYGIHFCNSDPQAAALSRHKYQIQKLLEVHWVPTPRTWLYRGSDGWLGGDRPRNGDKVIIKATYEAASIGIDEHAIRTVDDGIETFLTERASIFEQPLTVQEFIPGYEAEVPVLEASKPQALGVAGIKLDGRSCLGNGVLLYDIVDKDEYEFFDFTSVDPALSTRMKDIAVNVFKIVGLSGLGRVDFRIDREGRPFVTDVTDNPHLTRHSACASVGQWLGLTYAQTLAAMIGANARRIGLASRMDG
jgi:D-alanine-D-alanine ligase